MSTTNYAVPTGSFLDEWLEENQMTRAELARRLGVSRKHISQLVAGKVPLSYDLAESLELVTGVPTRVWNNYEVRYQADRARLRRDDVLERRFSEARAFPIDYLRRRGCVTAEWSNKAGVVRQLLEFFSVADFDSLLAYASQPMAAYRQSQAFEVDDYAVASWIQCGVHEVTERKVSDFDAELLVSLLPDLRALTLEHPAAFGKSMVDISAEAGVVVVFDPGPPGTRCSGVTHWVDETPVVQLTDRGKTNDKLWFTFFHEIGHVLLHSHHSVFVEGREQFTNDKAEAEADKFARDTLIPADDWAQRPNVRSEHAIKRFSAAIGVHPGIVVGRMQYESGNYAWGHRLKQKIQIVESKD
jgi:HTH-type transcriptional regulator/antitoxin HigA